MAEYIEREAALALVRPDAPEDEKTAVTIATAKKLVRSIVRRTPAADVAPVVHARWIEKSAPARKIYFECSHCAKDTATADACRVTLAIFFTALLDKEGMDAEQLQRIWREVEALSESVRDGYVSAPDLIRVLRDEYEIDIIGG